jgi:hypothetical protein
MLKLEISEKITAMGTLFQLDLIMVFNVKEISGVKLNGQLLLQDLNNS